MSTFLLPIKSVDSLDEYLSSDVGGLGLQRAQDLGPARTITEVQRSGLRGRGGAGFSTGRKWASVAGADGTLRYAVCNAAEGEPGTFKDRALIRANPYQLIEGLVIAGFAIGATEAFIGIKASFEEEFDRLTRAIAEMQEAGICRNCAITIVRGPDEYLFGEEKALLEVIEGGAPLPRLLPPHEHGLFATAPQLGWEAKDPAPGSERRQESNPTLVNNVETLSNIPHILAHGAEWFRTMGTPESPGTVIATVVGDVVAPDVGEVEMGVPLSALIEGVAAGLPPRRTVKAVFSGVANAVVTGAHLDVPVSHEGFAAIGSGLGAAGFIVFDDSACMVEVARQFSRFLAIESCGQCPACKTGSSEITASLDRLEAGAATMNDIDELQAWLRKVTDGNRCYLAVEEQIVVASILRSFPDEVVEHVERGACPRPRPVRLPKLVDLRGGTAIYDESHYRKRPDWTFAEG